MITSSKPAAAPASLRRSWVARSACAAFLIATAATARADAHLPEKWRIKSKDLPPEVVAMVLPNCGDDNQDPAKWKAFKIALDSLHTAYFLPCSVLAHEDGRVVVIGTVGRRFTFPKLSQYNEVYNVHFSRDGKTMIDTNHDTWKCTIERNWRWNGNQFILTKQVSHGC